MNRILAIVVALWAGMAFATGAVAKGTAGPVQFYGSVTIPAGDGLSTGNVIATVPKGFYLEVQSVSYYLSAPPSGEIGKIFVENVYGGVTAYQSIPEITANGLLFPGGVSSAPFYCGASTQIIVNAYRSGSTSAQQMFSVAITGVYVPVPAN